MDTSRKIGRNRLSIVGTVVLMLAAVANPSFASTPGTSGSIKPGQATGTNGQSPSAAYALQGDVANPTGASWTIFRSNASNATGVWDFGSYGTASGSQVLASHCLGSGSACTAIKGTSNSSGGATAAGVWGDGGTGSVGVEGSSNGTLSGSAAIYGANASSADYAYAVFGTVLASNGINSKGVVGTANQGIGVYGSASTGNGVYGSAGAGNGVYGTATSGVALFGNNTGTGSGFYGFSANGPGGVMGSNTTEGARFYTRNSTSYALVTGGLANTYGDAYITGHIYATGGCCSTVETNSGNRQMYAGEGTRAMFSDEGVATLINGYAVITIDPLFAQGVNLTTDYQVFLTPDSLKTAGLGVINKTANSFEVGELNGGTGNFKFDWRIDAPRKGHETERMAPAPAAPANTGSVYELPQDLPTAINSLEQEAAIKTRFNNK